MAIKYTQKEKGIDCNYWKIITSISDYKSNTTNSIIGLYASKEARDNDINGFLLRETKIMEGAELDREAQYKNWKEPVYEENVDEEGKQETIQVNKFFEAKDV